MLIVKERRERQKQATRIGILSAARKIARTEGWNAVTIRRIADAIEYTPPIVYEYFTSKDAILAELQRIGFEELRVTLQSAGIEAADETERAVQISLAYWRFAQSSPELYQLMHGWESTALPLEVTLVSARKASAVVEEALKAWAEETGTILPDPQGAGETLWALLHGLVTIRSLDRLGGDLERAEQLTAQGVRDLLFAWASRRK